MKFHSPPLYRVVENVSAVSNFELWHTSLKIWQDTATAKLESFVNCDLGELTLSCLPFSPRVTEI